MSLDLKNFHGRFGLRNFSIKFELRIILGLDFERCLNLDLNLIDVKLK